MGHFCAFLVLPFICLNTISPADSNAALLLYTGLTKAEPESCTEPEYKPQDCRLHGIQYTDLWMTCTDADGSAKSH